MSVKEWTIYIIRTESGTLYTGITTDLERRLIDHKTGENGAKFFRLSAPQEVLFQEQHPDRSSATKREIAIKKMSRCEKEELIRTQTSR